MKRLVRYLTHPQVKIEPNVPVPSWGLHAVGHARVRELVEAGWLSGTTQIVSSGERKAIETAAPIAAALGVELEVIDATHENDRSATGVLSPPEFVEMANAFFAQPEASVRGWERAIDAQARIVREVEAVLSRDTPGDVLFVGHGAVGTLLYCHIVGAQIDRTHDQPNNGGHYFTFTKEGRGIVHPWRPMEMSPPSV